MLAVAGLSIRPSDATDANTAEQELAVTYEACLATLTPENQKGLREAQSAWLIFMAKNTVSMRFLEGASRYEVQQVRERIARLRESFITFQYSYADTLALRKRYEEQLTSMYNRCIAILPPAQVEALREAQREWIKYRDLDADAAVLAARQSNRGTFRGYSVMINAAQVRTTELRRMYIDRRPPAPEYNPEVEAPRLRPSMLVTREPDPAVEPFLADAKAILCKLAEAKEGAFFDKAEVVSKIRPLKGELSTKLSGLQSRGLELLGRPTSNSASEVVTIHLLQQWDPFVACINRGDPDAAEGKLPGAESNRPTSLAPAYAPIWDAIYSWEEVFLGSLVKYREHVKRASSLSNLGKTSEAIREYQAAFQLFENPEITKSVKHLRNQSLGL